MKKFYMLFAGLMASLFASTSMAALDTLVATTAITGAVADVETVAGAIIAAAAVLFGISKIRQVIKA